MLAGAPPRIEPSHEGEVARLRGAAALIFQRHPVSERNQPRAARGKQPHRTKAKPARSGRVSRP
jgi:hypothetical protein